MNARKRDLIRESFAALRSVAKAREAEALEAMTQLVARSDNPATMCWGPEADAALAEAVVLRALADAEAIATGDARAVPVEAQRAKGAPR